MKDKKKPIAQKFFQYDGDFYSYTGKIFDLVVVSIYWLIGCLPIVTIGASFSALYAAVTKSVRQDNGTITKRFWHAYRQNLRTSIPLTVVYGGVMFLLLLNIGILLKKGTGLFALFFMVLYIIVGVFVLICACYCYPALSVFEMPAGWFIKLSGYLAIRHLPLSVLLFCILAASYLAVFAAPAAVIILPGVGTFVASVILEPVLEKHMPGEKDGIS